MAVLVVHRSERADYLADALGRVLADPLPDPITPEVVAVPTRGVERWLTQRLSHPLGVCANLQFPFPGALVTRATAAALGFGPDDDPWRPERCVWPLVELIDDHIDDPRLRPLAAHLRAATPPAPDGSARPPRRFAAARRIADLFERYSVHRPDLILGWIDSDEGGDPSGAWQAHLWRLLRQRVGVESPAERSRVASGAIAGHPELLDLPARVCAFGLTSLPPSHLDVFDALGTGRDVHLFLLHPSGALWQRMAQRFPAPGPALSRTGDPTARLATNPLLRSWGRDSREMQLVLAGRDVPAGPYHPVVEGGAEPPSLLQRIQSDIRADRLPPGRAGADPPELDLPELDLPELDLPELDLPELDLPELDVADTSLRVHACHGRARQVEVLRDAVLHLLSEDPTLEARDVIVMCPDIEAFAPLIQAAFGSARPAAESGPQLRVKLADRALRQTNPLLGVAAQLLFLAASRVTAPQVVDLASRPPVARRFGFDHADLSLLETWVAETAIRWGLDSGHRGEWALGGLAANTWAAGLDRLLLGVAMSDEECRLFGSTVPLGDVPSGAVDLAGRVAEMVGRLASAIGRLTGRQPVDAWVDALVEGTELLAMAPSDDRWQHDQLRRTLSEVADEAGPGVGPDLSLDEVRSLLGVRLQGRPTRANFRTGDLTICTLVPMRSVPHRVVALLGLDDGAFPRHPETDGDDLLLAEPRVGDRDARSEDRQLLLDALLAATDKLVITYSGRDERTNRHRAPCVPVSELLDVVDATARGPDGRPARDRVVVHHPLQPFDARNFTSGALAGPGPWSYDQVFLAGARAAGAQRPLGPWLPGPLPGLDDPVIQLDDLVSFVEHPVRAFLRRRLGLYAADAGDELGDAIPIELDGLEKWEVGDRLLEAGLAGVELDRAERAERARGLLPPGPLADAVLDEIRGGVEELMAAVAALGYGPAPADSLDVHVELPDGRTLVGTVPSVRGGAVVRCVYSRLAPKHRLAAWVRFLALTAARPDLAVTAVTVGRGQKGQPPQVAQLVPLAPGGAGSRLAVLLDLYDRGLREPLPISCATSAAWAASRRAGAGSDEAMTRAGREWTGSDLVPGEQADAYHVHVWGRYRSLASVMADRPAGAEQGPGWRADESSRFGRLARRLWDDLLDHEHLGPAR